MLRPCSWNQEQGRREQSNSLIHFKTVSLLDLHSCSPLSISLSSVPGFYDRHHHLIIVSAKLVLITIGLSSGVLHMDQKA